MENWNNNRFSVDKNEAETGVGNVTMVLASGDIASAFGTITLEERTAQYVFVAPITGKYEIFVFDESHQLLRKLLDAQQQEMVLGWQEEILGWSAEISFNVGEAYQIQLIGAEEGDWTEISYGLQIKLPENGLQETTAENDFGEQAVFIIPAENGFHAWGTCMDAEEHAMFQFIAPEDGKYLVELADTSHLLLPQLLLADGSGAGVLWLETEDGWQGIIDLAQDAKRFLQLGFDDEATKVTAQKYHLHFEKIGEMSPDFVTVTKTVSVKESEEFLLAIYLRDAMDLPMTFQLSYDPEKLSVLDFAAQTYDQQMMAGVLNDTSVALISHDVDTGMAVMTLQKDVANNIVYSGTATVIRFIAKATAETQIRIEKQ